MTTILIVDDEKSMRDFLNILLVKEGYKVLTAPDGDQALKLISDNQINLVISDIRMPGISGLELLARIKEEPEDIPVIMITATPAPAINAIPTIIAVFQFTQATANVTGNPPSNNQKMVR